MINSLRDTVSESTFPFYSLPVYGIYELLIVDVIEPQRLRIMSTLHSLFKQVLNSL